MNGMKDEREKEEREMKEKVAGKLGFVGAGIGLGLFAIFGLQPGAFVGGLLGLNVSQMILGASVEPTVLARLLVAAGMLTGVMVAGLIFTVGGAFTGWFAGLVIDSASKAGKKAETVEARR